jgi:acyl-CoA synthetase (AMP-forming)/AMP-acid ligase II/pimeloyl-ACP methyl ester carboxylesterase
VIPFRSRFLQIGSHRVHYVDEYMGPQVEDPPTILCLHGNPTWLYFYRNVISALQRQFRVIAMDFIGCGLSDHPSCHFRAADRIAQLEEFVRQLGLKQFSLLMHDWGGALGTGLAIRLSSQITSLAYLNTTLTETEALPAIIRRAAHPLVGPFLTKYSTSFLRLTTEVGVYKRLDSEVKKAYLAPYRTIASREAIWGFVADIPFTSEHPSYSTMLEIARGIPQLQQKPVLILWGLRDPCFHREMLTQVARHFPAARVVEIAQASHLVLEDAPEVCVTELQKFFSAQLPHKEASQASADRPTPQTPQAKEAGTSEHSLSSEQNISPLYAAFRRRCLQQPEAVALILPTQPSRAISSAGLSYTHLRYSALAEIVNKYERGLTELGLESGDRVLMLVPPGVEFLALSYAVMGRGAVPVFVDPGIGMPALVRCIEDADPQAFIGTPRAQLLRLLRRKVFSRIKFSLSVSEWRLGADASLSLLRSYASVPMPASSNKGVSLIAFTSGATGNPKGVLFSNQVMAAQLEILSKVFGMQAGDKDLPLLPIFSLFNLPLGVASVVAPIDPKHPLSLDPDLIVKIIDDLSIQQSFGSPTLWNKIADFCLRSRRTLPSLKRIFMAGAPVPLEVVQKVQQLLPNGQAFTPYGATEALPVTLIAAHELEALTPVPAVSSELGTYVGKAVPGVHVRVVRVSEDALSESELQDCSVGEIGEIIVSGASVSAAYLARPDANKFSKVKCADGSFWHRMGDMGYLDADQGLYFCGRKAHRVTAAGGKVWYSIPTERIFNQHPKVRRSALVALERSNQPAIVIEPKPEFWPSNEQAQAEFTKELCELARSTPLTQSLSQFFFHQSFPVDSRHNAKIFRDRLGAWASEQVAAARQAA